MARTNWEYLVVRMLESGHYHAPGSPERPDTEVPSVMVPTWEHHVTELGAEGWELDKLSPVIGGGPNGFSTVSVAVFRREREMARPSGTAV
jgi:hypothetical protein